MMYIILMRILLKPKKETDRVILLRGGKSLHVYEYLSDSRKTRFFYLLLSLIWSAIFISFLYVVFNQELNTPSDSKLITLINVILGCSSVFLFLHTMRGFIWMVTNFNSTELKLQKKK